MLRLLYQLHRAPEACSFTVQLCLRAIEKVRYAETIQLHRGKTLRIFDLLMAEMNLAREIRTRDFVWRFV